MPPVPFMGAWGDNGAIQTLPPPISLSGTGYAPVSLIDTEMYYSAESGWPNPQLPPSPASPTLLSKGWRDRGINLGFMGTPLLSALPVCLPASLFFIVGSSADVCGCGAPFNKRLVVMANDDDIKDRLVMRNTLSLPNWP